MIWRRGKTSPARATSRRSSWNSVDLDGAGFDLDRLGQRRAVELAAAQLGAHAAEQLAHREGLGDVVVGADLEPDDLVDLGVLGGQEDDRHGAARAHVAADVEPARPRHHDVEDEQVVGDAVADPLGRLVAARRRGHLEALLGEGVADRVAHRGLVVGDQDAAAAHRPPARPLMRPGSG
jgi:hypothetical protein